MANATVPFEQRLTCSLEEGIEYTSIRRTKFYELLREGKIKSTMVGSRRLILVSSLLKLLQPQAHYAPQRTGVHNARRAGGA
jgi:excisionase family DNA binding protein